MARASAVEQISASDELVYRDDCRALRELDDGHVVRRHLEGDCLAFGTLVDRHQIPLLNFIYRSVPDRDRAEDLMQEVFVRAFRHLHRFDQTRGFSSWIHAIAADLVATEAPACREVQMPQRHTTHRSNTV